MLAITHATAEWKVMLIQDMDDGRLSDMAIQAAPTAGIPAIDDEIQLD